MIVNSKYNQNSNWRTSAFGKFRVSFTLLLALIWAIIPAQADAKRGKGNVYKEKYAAFVMDADTGLILHRENANKSLHPASLTKMMTLLMVFDALDRGKLKLYHRVRISEHAASMIPSKLDLPVGSSIKVKDAIHALTTKSANDVAVALAEKLGGTESNFAVMMTKKARKIGMTKTRFKNASGLHDPRQVSTARDIARLSRALINDYGRHYHYFSKQSFTYQGKTYKSHNKLMQTYPGMDGLKTGYIKASGFNLAASAVQNDRRLIGVVFGGRTGKLRNAQMQKILDNAFQKVQTLQIANRHVPIPQTKPEFQTIELASMEPATKSYEEPEIIDIRPPNVSRWDMLDSSLEHSMFNRMIGQGDYDQTVRSRIETGLIAISAHMRETLPPELYDEEIKPVKLASSGHIKNDASKAGHWAIQIGAFTTRDRVNIAITQSLEKLPGDLKHGNSIVAPLKTAQGWIYRGRLQGYTKAAANDACRILHDCIPISPDSQ